MEGYGIGPGLQFGPDPDMDRQSHHLLFGMVGVEGDETAGGLALGGLADHLQLVLVGSVLAVQLVIDGGSQIALNFGDLQGLVINGANADHTSNVFANRATEQNLGSGFNDDVRADVHGKVDFTVSLLGVIAGHLGTFRDLAMQTSGMYLQSDLSHATWRDGPVVADHRAASAGFDAEDSEFFTTRVFYFERVGYDLPLPVGAGIMAGRQDLQGWLDRGGICLGDDWI